MTGILTHFQKMVRVPGEAIKDLGSSLINSIAEFSSSQKTQVSFGQETQSFLEGPFSSILIRWILYECTIHGFKTSTQIGSLRELLHSCLAEHVF